LHTVQPEPEDATVRLTAAHADRIAHIMGLVEEFFSHHTGPGTRSALGRFAAAEGWPPPRSAAGLIDEVCCAAAPLHRAIRAARTARFTPTTSRPAP